MTISLPSFLSHSRRSPLDSGVALAFAVEIAIAFVSIFTPLQTDETLKVNKTTETLTSPPPPLVRCEHFAPYTVF